MAIVPYLLVSVFYRSSFHLRRFRSSRLNVFCKKGVLRNFAKFTGKHLCQSLFFNKVAGLRTLAQVLSCEFCEISNNIYSYRTPPVAASEGLYAFFEFFFVNICSVSNLIFNSSNLIFSNFLLLSVILMEIFF